MELEGRLERNPAKICAAISASWSDPPSFAEIEVKWMQLAAPKEVKRD